MRACVRAECRRLRHTVFLRSTTEQPMLNSLLIQNRIVLTLLLNCPPCLKRHKKEKIQLVRQILVQLALVLDKHLQGL